MDQEGRELQVSLLTLRRAIALKSHLSITQAQVPIMIQPHQISWPKSSQIIFNNLDHPQNGSRSCSLMPVIMWHQAVMIWMWRYPRCKDRGQVPFWPIDSWRICSNLCSLQDQRSILISKLRLRRRSVRGRKGICPLGMGTSPMRRGSSLILISLNILVQVDISWLVRMVSWME